MDKDYYLGLDVGSDSVGWATADEDYQLCRIKGKTAWGARLFDAASSAADRRTFRTSRRRLQRRKNRIAWLNQLLGPVVLAKDPTFFLRLEDSFFVQEDKREGAKAPCLIFPSLKEEKAYYDDYPTIWHLRQALINNDEKAFSDPRLVYMAIHHIIKYRGNFLHPGSMDVSEKDTSVFERLSEYLNQYGASLAGDEWEDLVFINPNDYARFYGIACDVKAGKQARKKEMLALFQKPEESGKEKPIGARIDMFCSLCAGGDFSSDKINKEADKVTITCACDFDEKEEEFEAALGDDFAIVLLAKTIYDYAQLSAILGQTYKRLSDAFVNIYKAHKEQKKALQVICKQIDAAEGVGKEKGLYFRLFKDLHNPQNYAAFIRDPMIVPKDRKPRPSIEDFNKYILAEVSAHESSMSEESRRSWIGLKELAQSNLLLETISIRSTSVIPHQLHLMELETIIENGSRRGLTYLSENKEKLINLFLFRIPYYCGPLAGDRSHVAFADAIKERITPWNIDQKIDWATTKQNFMASLVSKCTYLRGEPVLPRQSLLFEEFDTYNKLNGMTINSQPLTEKEKEMAASFIFSRPKTTLAALKKHFGSAYREALFAGVSEIDGFSAPSHAFFFRELFGLKFDAENADSVRHLPNYEMAEDIILLKCIFTDNPADGDGLIKERYPELTEEQLSAIRKFSCKGWSSLSKALITLPYSDENGEVQGYLIDLLIHNRLTFNAVYFDKKYGFQAEVDRRNNEFFGLKKPLQRIQEIIEAIPPNMRRATIQAYRIADEVARFAKRDPLCICLEVTRAEDETKKRKYTEDRTKQIRNFLSALAKVDHGEKESVATTLAELERASIADKLRGKHLYLYFLQNGKDAYSGEPIDIEDVLTGEAYDTDHIIPQSFMKDDSLDNLVLVRKEVNQHRQNEYPLPSSIRNNPRVQALWKMWRKAGMMSEKKYANLTRSTPMRDEELTAFVAAQLNVVNYTNKTLAEIFRIRFPRTKIIFSKAKYASQIRQELDIPKIRELNDCHHAVDAYLNIVSGTKLQFEFGDMSRLKAIEKAISENPGTPIDESLNMTRFISRLIVQKDTHVPTRFGEQILAISQRHDILLTYRQSYSDRGFYNQTLYGPGAYEDLVPVHYNDTRLGRTDCYGGFSGTSSEVQLPVTVIGKKKTWRTIVGIPHMLWSSSTMPRKAIEECLRSALKLKKDEIINFELKSAILNNSCIVLGGLSYLLVSSNDTVVALKPIKPIFLPLEHARYLSEAMKCVEKSLVAKEAKESQIITKNRSRETFEVSAQHNLSLLKVILSYASFPGYDYVPMIAQLRDIDAKELLRIGESTLIEQIKIIIGVIGLFGRNSTMLCPSSIGLTNNFRKARSALMSDNPVLQLNSITGLISSKKPL